MERLERTDLGQQDFEQHQPVLTSLETVQKIMQSIIAENPYKPDMVWEVWHVAHELEEINALPHGVTAEDIFQEYLRVFEGEGRG